MDRTLDAQIATAIMGWVETDQRPYDANTNWGGYPQKWYVYEGDVLNVSQIPRYSENLYFAFEMETALPDDLRDTYYVQLCRVVDADKGDGSWRMFDYIHATAEQRCRAALEAINEE